MLNTKKNEKKFNDTIRSDGLNVMVSFHCAYFMSEIRSNQQLGRTQLMLMFDCSESIRCKNCM